MQTSTSSDSRSIDRGSKWPFSSVIRLDTDCEKARTWRGWKGGVRRATRRPEDTKEVEGLRAGDARAETEGVAREYRDVEDRSSRLSRGKTAPFDAIVGVECGEFRETKRQDGLPSDNWHDPTRLSITAREDAEEKRLRAFEERVGDRRTLNNRSEAHPTLFLNLQNRPEDRLPRAPRANESEANANHWQHVITSSFDGDDPVGRARSSRYLFSLLTTSNRLAIRAIRLHVYR